MLPCAESGKRKAESGHGDLWVEGRMVLWYATTALTSCQGQPIMVHRLKQGPGTSRHRTLSHPG